MRKLGSIAVQVHRQSLLERWARAGIRRQSAEAQSPAVQWKYLQTHDKECGEKGCHPAVAGHELVSAVAERTGSRAGGQVQGLESNSVGEPVSQVSPAETFYKMKS